TRSDRDWSSDVCSSDLVRCVVTWAAVATFDRCDEETKRAWREQGFLLVHNARTGQDLRLGATALADLEQNRTRLDLLAACRRLRSEERRVGKEGREGWG